MNKKNKIKSLLTYGSRGWQCFLLFITRALRLGLYLNWLLNHIWISPGLVIETWTNPSFWLYKKKSKNAKNSVSLPVKSTFFRWMGIMLLFINFNPRVYKLPIYSPYIFKLSKDQKRYRLLKLCKVVLILFLVWVS